MTTEIQPNGNMLVQNYGLAEWLAEIEQQINAGYKFDFESNDCYPQNMGYMFYAVMVPKNDGKQQLTVKIDASDVQPLLDETIKQVKQIVAEHEQSAVEDKIKLQVQKRGKLAKVVE